MSNPLCVLNAPKNSEFSIQECEYFISLDELVLLQRSHSLVQMFEADPKCKPSDDTVAMNYRKSGGIVLRRTEDVKVCDTRYFIGEIEYFNIGKFSSKYLLEGDVLKVPTAYMLPIRYTSVTARHIYIADCIARLKHLIRHAILVHVLIDDKLRYLYSEDERQTFENLKINDKLAQFIDVAFAAFQRQQTLHRCQLCPFMLEFLHETIAEYMKVIRQNVGEVAQDYRPWLYFAGRIKKMCGFCYLGFEMFALTKTCDLIEIPGYVRCSLSPFLHDTRAYAMKYINVVLADIKDAIISEPVWYCPQELLNYIR